jgi:hypothetical protein
MSQFEREQHVTGESSEDEQRERQEQEQQDEQQKKDEPDAELEARRTADPEKADEYGQSGDLGTGTQGSSNIAGQQQSL